MAEKHIVSAERYLSRLCEKVFSALQARDVFYVNFMQDIFLPHTASLVKAFYGTFGEDRLIS